MAVDPEERDIPGIQALASCERLADLGRESLVGQEAPAARVGVVAHPEVAGRGDLRLAPVATDGEKP